MADKRSIHKAGNSWFVETANDVIGPLESEHEAVQLLTLLKAASAARKQVACVDAECNA